MSGLQQALAAMAVEKQDKKAKTAAKPRLVADPTMGMGDLMEVHRKFLKFKNSKDLWGLCQPGPSSPRVFSFKTRPDASWMLSLSDLMYDMLDLAQNTKIASK